MTDNEYVNDTPEHESIVRVVSTFDRINVRESTAIYAQLTEGKLLVKHVLVNGGMQDNPLFNVVFDNQAHFRDFFAHMGYELILAECGDFYHLRDPNDDESSETNANETKVQILLLMIGRYYAASARSLADLGNPVIGLGRDDIEAIDAQPLTADLLLAGRFQRRFSEEMEFLTRRHVAFDLGGGAIVLSDAGMAFLNNLVDAYAARQESESGHSVDIPEVLTEGA
ncbi:MAG: hypothetical protein B0D91_02950 [Oceanospirillales bacterium LUC14_002_19_P2]|nr:MAG: hypothetical protein B0D91_02950 [Oceanospirillales bacterium LUC14_002_19_P2]